MTAPASLDLFEAHLLVGDLDRSASFYRDVVGLSPALELPARGAAFFWIGDPGEAMLGLWSLGSAPVGVASHVAFSAPLDHVLAACERLRSLNVTPLSFFATETEEPSVIGWMPAAAVYFRDPDGHLLEYLAMLDSAPDPEAGVVSWSEWVQRRGHDDRAATSVRVALHTGRREELRALFAMAEDSEAQLEAYLDAGDVLVATADGEIVGHVQIVDAGDGHSEIKNMAVDASYRRRGIGRRLVEAAIDEARGRNASRLVVATAAADIDNLRFYQRAGFRLGGIDRDVFTAAAGYAPRTVVDGIELRDRVWLDLDLD